MEKILYIDDSPIRVVGTKEIVQIFQYTSIEGSYACIDILAPNIGTGGEQIDFPPK